MAQRLPNRTRFLLLQICAVAAFQSDAFIISRFLPIEMVTPYSVGQRAFSQLIGVLVIVTASLWPAFGNAKALGDVVWMQRIYRKVILYSLLTYGAFFLLLATFGSQLFALWVGGRSAPSTLLICAIGFNYLLILWTNNHAVLLNALGVIRKQVIINVSSCHCRRCLKHLPHTESGHYRLGYRGQSGVLEYQRLVPSPAVLQISSIDG